MLIAGSVGLSLFLWIYLTAINGFYAVDVDGQTMRLHYALPSRTHTLRNKDIAKIESAYDFKMVWRLRLETHDGTRYESAEDSRSNVDAVRDHLRTILKSIE
jgi:hypothetical protein